MALLFVTASLPDHCTPQNYFLTNLSTIFQSCVPTPLAFLSTLLGSFSILSWLFAQLPQIYKNYTLSSTSGLSVYFLVEWLLGDATNLTGAVLTGQATWQVVIASYYVFVDIALVFQYFWYTYYKPWRKAQRRLQGWNADSPDDSTASSIIDGDSGVSSSSTTRPSSSDGKLKEPSAPTRPLAAPFNSYHFPSITPPREKGSPSSSNPNFLRIQQSTSSPGPSPKTMLLMAMLCAVLSTASPLHNSALTISAAEHTQSNRELIGRLSSWTSTLLYLGSRLPQLYKNHVRRSTDGLSPALFIAAFFGNLFYSSSIITNPLAWSSYPPYGLHGWVGPEGSDQKTWVALAAPFWLGAAGVLALDAAMGAQFLVFGERDIVVRVGRDKRGRSKWRRVSGWMRGWIPTGIPERKKVFVVEERRVLLGSGVVEAGDYGTA